MNSIPKSWKETPLVDFASFQRGFDITKKEMNPSGRIPVFSSSGFHGFNSEAKVDGPGIVIGRKGTLGTVHFSKTRFWPHDTTLWVTDFHGNNPLFAYYFLQGMHFEQYDCGASNPTLNRNHIHGLPVRYPSVDIQKKIAAILSAYDDLIENNERRIKILEEMAQNLYREWFVNFRFPGHEKVKMVDSPLGQIPEGWEVKRLDAVVQFCSKGTNAGQHLAERVYLPIDCLPRKSLSVSETRPWEEAQSSLHLFDEGDILFGAMRPYFHKVVVAPFDGVTRKTCFVFKPALANTHSFVTLLLFQDSTVAFASSHSKGATIPYAVWPNAMDAMQVLVPNDDLLATYESLVAPILLRIRRSSLRSNVLRQTRDMLLPKLISGDLDVSELEIEIWERE